MTTRFGTVDDYIASFQPETRQVLQEVRAAMHRAVPGAGETISYGMPTITVDRRAVVYFAGWKRHVSVYPVPDGDAQYEAAIGPYRSGASTARFPLSEPVPYELIAEIARLLASRTRPG